jgi:hypothetical protein
MMLYAELLALGIIYLLLIINQSDKSLINHSLNLKLIMLSSYARAQSAVYSAIEDKISQI